MKKLLAKGFIILFALGMLSIYVFFIIKFGWVKLLLIMFIGLVVSLAFHLFELAVKEASNE